jgi:hypothetical protein
MNTLITSRDAKDPWKLLTWKQGIFSERIPQKFDGVCGMWSTIRTVVLWSLWIEWNDVMFNNVAWSPNKLLHKIWIGLIDYGQVEWLKFQGQAKKCPMNRCTLVKSFARRWGRNGVCAHYVEP